MGKNFSPAKLVKDFIGQAGEEGDFSELAIRVFRHQAENCPVYREFLELLKIDPKKINDPEKIPFLPISFFRSHRVECEPVTPSPLIFESSGTTGQNISRHFVSDPDVYELSLSEGFKIFAGDPKNFIFLSLLPGYLERGNSSLVYMINHLMKKGGNDESGFYLNNFRELAEKLITLEKSGKKIILFGVSYALLRFSEQFPIPLKNTMVVETGGMKGMEKEMVREELHGILSERFKLKGISSEYGMTELFSQAWSAEGGIFKTPPWMRVLIRDPETPNDYIHAPGKTGGINVIDLANVNSCSFIATMDLGRLEKPGGFEVMGRYDNSDLRGCNLLAV
jgi:phenylacetate-coenzyme A ligase PaaK-like adenylate-forming protein